MKPRTSVRERISPGLTASLFANYRSSVEALLELVDNFVDSGSPGGSLRVELSIQPSSITITGVGGAGMGPEDFRRHYLNWGGSHKRGQLKLGQYGQGGKAAIGFLGSRFSIESSRPGEEVAWRISDPDYRKRDRLKTYEVERVTRRFPDAGYVRVRVDGVDKRVDERRLMARLADTYRPLLESSRLSIRLGGQDVKPSPLEVETRRQFRVRAAGTMLTGWYGLRAEPGSDAGFRLYRLGRLIASAEFFGHPVPAQAPNLGRLIGEMEVPRVQLTMNKSDFDRDSEPWVEIDQRMHLLITPVVRRLARGEQQRPPAGALRAAEQARRLLSQALRLVDNPDLFPGFEEDRGGRPAGKDQTPLPLEIEPAADEAPADTSRSPRAPEPPARTGSRRRRGFGEIVIRPLEQSIRSQAVLEEGVRKVVINSNHPLFKERRGDTWYQLETAAREICQDADPVDVADFERRVNQILLTAFRLKARQGRRPRSDRQLRLPGSS
ncbi:MAG: ATP-binding protein [Candidatus Dormibacteraeota bacterium]|nr:ATP-binding protein [Candidatus Dormibacteraeota bacterium]